MVIDSSAILAVLLGEPNADRFSAEMAEAEILRISAVSYFEVSMILDTRKGIAGRHELDFLIRRSDVRIESFDPLQARIAREAFHRFGKGRHRAGLNFGDCCSYALAKLRNEPLLFKGSDFSLTDIASAI